MLACLCFADRCITKEGYSIVQEIQNLFTEYLENVLKENHFRRKHLFGKVLLFLTDLRTYTAYFDFHVDNLFGSFKYTLPLTADVSLFMSAQGLSYDAAQPSCDDAPPAKRVRELLIGNSMNANTAQTDSCFEDIDLDEIVNDRSSDNLVNEIERDKERLTFDKDNRY